MKSGYRQMSIANALIEWHFNLAITIIIFIPWVSFPVKTDVNIKVVIFSFMNKSLKHF